MTPLLTISDWQSAYRNGADPMPLLHQLRSKMAERGLPVYLHVLPSSSLNQQLEALEGLAANYPSREQLLQANPLWGIPFVVKDNIDVADTPTTAACPAFEHKPPRHAVVVQRLLDSGAVCMAKTNLDQFATGLVGSRSPFGSVSSAWSADHISGGSSSGSAVAVATGDVPFSLGTDTAGSGRVPAAFNHVVGFKPTPGRSPTAGVLPACRSLDCVSIFGLTVQDAASVLAIIEGPSAEDAYSRVVQGPSKWRRTLRIGIPSGLPDGVGSEESRAFQQAQAMLQAMGHEIVHFDFKSLEEIAALLYQGPWVAERHLVIRDLLDSQPDTIEPSVRQVISKAKQYTADDVFAAQYRLKALCREANALWNGRDTMLVLSAPNHLTHDEVAADPIGVNASLGVFTNFVNLLGWCALALPVDISDQGLPLGITFIAPEGHDAALAAFGNDFQKAANQPLGFTGEAFRNSERVKGLRVAPTLPLAVVGAHLTGLPLNHQLTDLGATLREATQTAPHYCLFALPGTTPAKPGMQKVPSGGRPIDVEVWDMPIDKVGQFLAGIPPPLGIGSVELASGLHVHGFLCESHALERAKNISHFGGWRAYLSSL